MDRHDYINLKTLTLDELAGVVGLYPWYGGARRELCVRMARLGGETWGREQYADAALYLGDRGIISEIVRNDGTGDYSDKDLEKILRAYIREEPETEERPVRVVGGDYFTQSQYEKVRRSEDNVFSRFTAAGPRKEASDTKKDTADVEDFFCTETLAQIFADQGRYEEAKRIYSKLLLKFPEKNAYFAALIEKLKQEI